MKSIYLDNVRSQNPLIHNMTNAVVMPFTANGLLAMGASPLMSTALGEMESLPQISQALLINIGTVDDTILTAMLVAGKTANKVGIPVVLDPVGVGATAYRQGIVEKLLAEVKFDVIRGNVAELAQLAGVAWQAKGVEAGEGSANRAEIVRMVANKYQTVVAMSGEIDYISDGKRIAKIVNGTPMFPNITGSGCLLGAILATFASVASGHIFEAICEGAAAYAIAGELAAKNLQPTELGTFGTALLDQLGALSAHTIEHYARMSDE